MIRWEYKVDTPPVPMSRGEAETKNSQLRDWLNDLGASGWEIAGGCDERMVFKRMKPEN